MFPNFSCTFENIWSISLPLEHFSCMVENCNLWELYSSLKQHTIVYWSQKSFLHKLYPSLLTSDFAIVASDSEQTIMTWEPLLSRASNTDFVNPLGFPITTQMFCAIVEPIVMSFLMWLYNSTNWLLVWSVVYWLGQKRSSPDEAVSCPLPCTLISSQGSVSRLQWLSITLLAPNPIVMMRRLNVVMC